MATSDITSELKQCVTCKAYLPLTAEYFCRSKYKSDGLATKCKSCKKQYITAWNAKHPEKSRQYNARYDELHPEKRQASQDKYKETHRSERYQKFTEYCKNNPDKRRAHIAVRVAVEAGKLPSASTLPCENCGKPACDYHHWSYAPEHRLDVIPLCKKCHREAHK